MCPHPNTHDDVVEEEEGVPIVRVALHSKVQDKGGPHHRGEVLDVLVANHALVPTRGPGVVPRTIGGVDALGLSRLGLIGPPSTGATRLGPGIGGIGVPFTGGTCRITSGDGADGAIGTRGTPIRLGGDGRCTGETSALGGEETRCTGVTLALTREGLDETGRTGVTRLIRCLGPEVTPASGRTLRGPLARRRPYLISPQSTRTGETRILFVGVEIHVGAWGTHLAFVANDCPTTTATARRDDGGGVFTLITGDGQGAAEGDEEKGVVDLHVGNNAHGLEKYPHPPPH